MSDILTKIMPNHETDVMLLKRHLAGFIVQAKRAVEIFMEDGEEAALARLGGCP